MQLITIRANLKDMLNTRGDDVSYIEEHGDAVEPSRYFMELVTLNTDKTTIFFALTKDILKDLRQNNESAEEMIEKYGTKNFIVILNEIATSNYINHFQQKDKELALHKENGMLQIFYKKELTYNPLKHTMVPKHEKLTDNEGKQIMNDYLIKNKTQLPIISKTDIISRWLGLKVGEIVRIIRYNKTSGEYFYYRVCI